MSAGDAEVVTLSTEQFEKAVTQATEAATQNVARIHRIRLTVYAGLAAFTAALAVLIPVTVVLSNQNRAAASTNAQRNCEATATARPQGNARAFDQIAFLGLLQDAIEPKPPFKASPQAKLFAERELRRINREAAYWRSFTVVRDNDGHVVGNELPVKIASFQELANTIHPVPLLDCEVVVKD